jgi:uncharacterized SAM-binding protein YcdF (DUF218 family)
MKRRNMNSKEHDREVMRGEGPRSKEHGGIIFRLLSLLLLALLCAAIYVVREPLMRMAGRLWVVSDPIERADAIIVIGDDNFNGDRAARAAQLYAAGWAPVILASGRKLRPFAGIAELIDKDLENRGVPTTSVIRFPHEAENTLEEAKALSVYTRERRWHRVLLVTSNYHTRRARYIFRKIFPTDVTVDVSSAQDSDFDPDAWWRTRKGTELFLHEIFGYGFAMWELRRDAGTT